MRRTREEAAETRKNIFDKAALAFKEKGYQKATLADIAKYAGVTRGAIARHYGDKQTLFREVIEAQMEDSVSHINTTMQKQLEPAERMDEFTDYLCANPHKMHVHVSLLNNLVKEQPPEFRDLTAEIHDHYRFILENLEVVVQRSIDAKQLHDHFDAEFIAKAIFSLIKGFFLDFDTYFSTYDPDEIRKNLGNLLRVMLTPLPQQVEESLG